MLGYGADGLVVTYKHCAAAFRAAMPDVQVEHWGAHVGADRYRDVSKMLIIGGPQPPPREVARLASAEAGRIVPIADPVPTPCRALLADGSGVEFNRLAYADPAASRVLAGIYDDSILQAAGRPRGLNRTAANPVEIIYWSNAPVSHPVEAIDRLRPVSKFEKIIERGIIPLGGEDMHRLYPDVITSGHAGRSAKFRLGGDAECRAAVRHKCGRLPWQTVRVILQPAGQGYGPRSWYLPRHRLAEVEALALREFGE